VSRAGWLAWAVVVATACGTGDREGDHAGTAGPTGGPGSAGDGDGDGDGSTGEDSAGTTSTGDGDGEEDPIFDVGDSGGGTVDDGGDDEGCTKVDILFVIDNSPSMGPYQEGLGSAFPGFIAAMYENLPPATDLHVGITTTSFFSGSCAESTSNCMTTATQQEVLAHYTKPGDGNTGENGGQGRLFEWDGQSYYSAVTGGDPWPLTIWFSDAAVAAGETGCSFEMSSAGAGYAFHPDNAATNTGFVRDEGAVLLIFFLTDEPDKSPEGAQVYHDMVTAAKAGCGGDQCVLVAGLVNTCIMGVNNALWQFMNTFPDAPTIGSIDDPFTYADVVGDALAQIIGQKCDEIPPEG
jgi:hypothetical protein